MPKTVTQQFWYDLSTTAFELRYMVKSLEKAYNIADCARCACEAPNEQASIAAIGATLEVVCVEIGHHAPHGRDAQAKWARLAEIADMVASFESLWGMPLPQIVEAFGPVMAADATAREQLAACLRAAGVPTQEVPS